MGFLSLLKKALPHFSDAEKIISAAKRDGAKGAAVAVIGAILSQGDFRTAGPQTDAFKALASAIDDHQDDLIELKARIITVEKELKALRVKSK